MRSPRARYGAFDIDSMPPATMQRASPARICDEASITLLRPEPQTLFTVVHGHALREPRAERGLTRRRLADAGLHDVAHEDLVDLVERHTGTLERRADRDRAELRRA